MTSEAMRISYADQIGLFFKAHDPTTLDRQGGDAGSQYRSIILCDGDEQRKAVEAADP